ncbi:hypothetical protein EYW49_13440 [Siculibacillus lacustris]|uniref:Peptidoglycan endopeptidase n=1 Tax=Siculibacillus lacustris TaxID=1549641 RepID=A0A4Q9VP06_9HYPH|nr:hypothetical protein [Siculibacillus lacustris]TBW36597.1 hypothetical protein EYW49_13440 [Siculibacillus lacustris]
MNASDGTLRNSSSLARAGLARAGRVVAAALLVSGLFAMAAEAQQPKVLRQFGLGSDKNSIGVTPGNGDVEPTGPSAIYAGRDGRIYLLDQVNGRILSMDGGKPVDAPDALQLPEDLIPQDLVAIKDRLYVWDGQVHALDTKESGEGPVAARAVSAVDDVTRSAFAQMGSQAPSSEAEVVSAAGRAASADAFDTPIKQFANSHGLGPVDIEILPKKDGKSAVVEVRAQNDPLNLHRFEVKVKHRLGAVEILDVSAKGGVYVFTENIPPTKDGASVAYVARYDGRGRLDAIYDLPIGPDQFPSRRFVTIAENGDVLYLKSDSTGVGILDLARRTPKGGIVDSPPVAKGAAPVLAGPGDAAAEQAVITAVRPGTRLGAIQIGLAFEGLKWTVTPQNYGPNPDTQCTGFGDRTRRPGYLEGKVGQEVRGVPYCWGCFGSFVTFKRQVDRGALAGNWCTKDNPRRDVVGVDCSAFVSQCWGLQRQYTTADIPSITEVLADPWSLKPGDALNKPGSHVMLFVKFTPDRKAEVLEASTGGCNGRVCRNVYPLSVLLARGYQPVRYKALKDQ